MDNKQKRDFTLRLSQCNQGEMIVIIYDILFVYLDDARAAYAAADREAAKKEIRKAQQVLDELSGSLNFTYELSNNLYALYNFCKSELSRSMYQNSLNGIEEAEKILRRLYSGFKEAARQDTSSPIMRNTQQVYAGMTYGRAALNETYMDVDTQRGFSA